MIKLKFTNKITSTLCVLAMLFFFVGQISAQTTTINGIGPVATVDNNTASLSASSAGIIPGGSTIDDVEISINITHTWVGDISASLVSPDGTSISLFDRPGNPSSFFGCSQDNISVDFSDAAAASAAALEGTCNNSFTGAGNPGPSFAISGAFQSIDALASLAGENAVGDWTLEVSDAFGGDGGFIESFELTVNFTAPPCEFNCPASQVVNLDPGACGQVISYDADAIAGCLSTTQTAGLPSGSEFPIGTTVNTFEYADALGAIQTCSFSITVNEYQVQGNSITCNSLVHITLDENCASTVGADQILEGNDYGCYDTYDVTFAATGLPLVLDGSHVGETIEVMVTNPAGVPCWGYI
ncbi:MAG: proprotein convertase P-domain-containing protein, partial [Saprospiraceae bacterium]|nr:proprotein convertase P-domain-containing protein [Saprospiraceae bacterium]